MKFAKKLLSLLLAVVMVVPMLGGSLTSSASITVSETPVTVSIVVPELIYLTPGSTSFQYYIAGAINGSTPSPTASTQGSISFIASKDATSITVKADGAESVTLSTTSASNTTSLVSQITAGTKSDSGLITWTFSYVIDGKQYVSTAYTYVYKPYLGQVGAQHGHRYIPSAGNRPSLTTYAFVTGIHSVTGGPYDCYYTGTSGYQMSPLVPGWSSANVPLGKEDAYIDDTYYPINASNTGGIASHSRTRSDSKTVSAGSVSTIGFMTVDSSRYASGTPLSNIPNFKAGFMIHFATNSSVTHQLNSFMSSDASLKFTSSAIEYKEDEQAYAYGLYSPIGTVPPASTSYGMTASFSFQRSNSSKCGINLTFAVNINIVNKAPLRTTVNNCVTANYQATDYTTDSYANYASALKNAYSVLGNPASSSAQLSDAQTKLASAVASLKKITFTATVYHKLPAADGFVYNYNGNDYTAENGYVTIVETKGFEAGADVTVTKEIFQGYNFVGTATQVYTDCYNDVEHTFTYQADTSVIIFNYGVEHQGYVIGNETTQITVSYGQPYENFPAPKMDGWRFVGWYDASNTYVSPSTICTMTNTSMSLNAVWKCNFAGGHGSEADPFLVATAAHFDSIDDTTVFCIVNDGYVSKGKYFKQTANIDFNLSKTPITSFAGNYNGQNYTVNVLEGTVLSGTTYGSVFGLVDNAVIDNLNINLAGELSTSGAGITYVGTFGYIDSSVINDVQVISSADFTVTTGATGAFAGAVAGTTSIGNSSITLNGGTINGDAFIGKTAHDAILTSSNNWVLINDTETGAAESSEANTMYVRENVDAVLRYTNGRYSFTATPDTGWSAEYRKADDALISGGAVYSPAASLSGAQYYICATKSVTLSSDSNGTLTGAGTYTLREGQSVEGLVPNASAGYTFSGWTNTTDGKMSDTAPYTFTMGKNSGTVTANYSVNTYKIVYNGNAGASQVDVPATANYNCDTAVTIGAAAKRAGYNFKEWNTKADGTGDAYMPLQQYNALSTQDGAQIILYAVWTPIYYSVMFEENGGTAVNDVTGLTYGSYVTFPTTTKTGYKNVMWFADANFTGSTYLPGTQKQVYDNATFYAKWTPVSYTITFIADGATNVPAPVRIQYDSGSFTIPSTYVPEKAGFIFSSWNTASGGNGTAYKPLDTIPGNLSAKDGDVIVLYAAWKSSDFTITWNITSGATIDGVTTNPTTKAVFGGMYDIPASVPVKDGYVFKGWFTEPEGGNQITAGSVVNVTADTSYYAQWDYATYYVTYDANGGTGRMADSTHRYSVGSALNENAFTRDGFTFGGWALTKDGSAVYADGATVSNLTGQNGTTVTLYAVWTGKRFSVNYNLNGATGALIPSSATMEAAAVNLRNYNKTAVVIGDSTYEFYGWAYTKEQADAMTVAYKNGASFALTEDLLDVLTVDLDAATPTVTLYAAWARHTTVTWNLMGGTMNSSEENVTTTVIYGQNYVLPEGEPMKIRNSFRGWYTSAELGTGTAVTSHSVLNTNEDTTVYAQWTQIGNLDSNYITEYYLQLSDGTYPEKPTTTTSGYAQIGTEVTAVRATYTGFTFNTNDERNVTVGNVIDALTGDILTLKLYYTRNQYDIAFNANGGEGEMETVKSFYEKEAILPSCEYVKTGYSFAGWAKTADGAVTYADGGAFSTPAMSTELFAKWTANKYTVEFYGNGATNGSMTRTQYTYDTAAVLPGNAFEKAGATFSGWALTEGGEAVYEDKSEVLNLTAENGGEVKLYAVWTNIEYTVTFDINGATEGTAPADETVVYGQKIVLTAGEGLKLETAEESRTLLGWYTEKDGETTEYAIGAQFTAPAEDVVLKALWSANYAELNAKKALVKGYRDEQKLPANEKNDPLYAAGGSIAEDFGFDGIYAWNNFETEALEVAYQNALKDSNKNLPQSQQGTVDALAKAIDTALNELVLKAVDYDYRYECYHYESGFYCDHDDEYYPACEEDHKHSFNSLLLLTPVTEGVLYTDESINALKLAYYGNGLDIKGIYNEVGEAALKAPVQALLGDYVDEMARLYHETLELRNADYTAVDKLITEYLPSLDGVKYEDLIYYYTEESITELTVYYENIDRTHKNVHQDEVDVIYDELKGLIDALVPYSADYTDVFELIVTIPYGTDGFKYPAATVTATTYSEWLAWARENAGKISFALDMEYLNTRYTQGSVSSLNNVLNGIDWTLEIFNQGTVSGMGNQSYVNLVKHAIEALAPRTYTITFMMNDGTETVYDTKYVNYGDAIAYPVADPTRGSEYVFKGWFMDAECTTPVGSTATVLSDMKIFAKWTDSSAEDITLIAQTDSSTIIDTERKYIYGVETGVTATMLDEIYLDVIGNGRLEYEYESGIGTGTKINLVNIFTGEIVDSYTLVIFGDLNGDGLINSSDRTIMNSYIIGSADASFNDVYVYAANLYNDTDINGTDMIQMKAILTGSAEYDQAKRELV